ncbi:MAG: hypothetical protein CEO22_421 [Candidatus Berkelbacteria bacterium Gr01-1014_85]|uniref:Uncharacterized protein n=1 Tax=Candidatus Berkelbacteria bacterium Gr01-1014_85 TaxID=2017150 RepID=A0A554JB64_9BACT|nr:MAG: hypothetical protein CEO22_421 [Candidatus Berkelbacteria bacterium Gr01-1014_85]
MPWRIVEGPDNHELYSALAEQKPITFTTAGGIKISITVKRAMAIVIDENGRPLSFSFFGFSLGQEPEFTAVSYCRQPTRGRRPRQLGLLSIGNEAQGFFDRIVDAGEGFRPELSVSDGPDLFSLVAAFISGAPVVFETAAIGESRRSMIEVIPRELALQNSQFTVTAVAVEDGADKLSISYDPQARVGAAQRL